MYNMSISVFRVVFCALIALTTYNAEARTRATSIPAAVKKACPSIVAVTSGGFIYKNSAPVRTCPVNTCSIAYFREEPTLIMSNNVSSKGWTKIFDSKGTVIGQCPWATADGTRGGRYRCTMSTRALRRSAVKNTASALIYIRLTASKCVSIPDAGACYGSTKGKCSTVLK